MKKSLVFITLCICLLISCTGVGYAVDTDDANDVLRFDSTGYEVKTATIYYYDEFEGPQAVKYSTDPFVEGFVDVETYTYEAYPMSTLEYVSWEGLQFVTNPTEEGLQLLNIYMPAEYLTGGTVNGYTIDTAPIFFPNTAYGRSNSKALQPMNATDEGAVLNAKPNEVYVALEQGYVVAIPACRNDVVDIKAAIRYLRYNADQIPGDIDFILTAGGSAGGQLATLFAVTGNNPEYYAALYELGAAGMESATVSTINDDVFAASVWTPMTNSDYQSLGYSWLFDNVTVQRNYQYHYEQAKMADGVFEDIENAKELKALYEVYIKNAGFSDALGTPLLLDEGGESGAYYDYVMGLLRLAAQKGYATPKWDERYEENKVLTVSDGIVSDLDRFAYANFITRMTNKGGTSASEYNEDGSAINPNANNPLNNDHMVTDDVAPYWRIRMGTTDRDTALTTSTELALALQNWAGVQVDHQFVWDVAHRVEYDMYEIFAWFDGIVTQNRYETAIATAVPLTLEGITAGVPTNAWEIDGHLYLQLGDIAKLVSGTSKAFGVSLSEDEARIQINGDYDAAYSDKESVGASDAVALDNFLALNEAIGSDRVYAFRATVYEIDGMKYFRLDDIASNAGFSMSYDAGSLTINADKAFDSYLDYYTGFPVDYDGVTYVLPAYKYLQK